MGLGKAYIAGRRPPTAGFMACLDAKIASPPARPLRPRRRFCRCAHLPVRRRQPVLSRPWAALVPVSIRGKRTANRKGAGRKGSPSAIASRCSRTTRGGGNQRPIVRGPRRDGIPPARASASAASPNRPLKQPSPAHGLPARGDARGRLVGPAPDTAWPCGRARRPRAQAWAKGAPPPVLSAWGSCRLLAGLAQLSQTERRCHHPEDIGVVDTAPE